MTADKVTLKINSAYLRGLSAISIGRNGQDYCNLPVGTSLSYKFRYMLCH